MIFTPETSITLVRVPLTIDNNDTFDFTNLNAQTTYFNSLSKLSFSEYTFIQKDSTITVEGNIENLYNYNYLFYKNKNKTYYCFITNMRYIAEEVTEITIETDVLQTYLFDIQYHNVFVEREHVSDDTIGVHTVPESVELGSYVTNTNKSAIPYNYGGTVYCVGVSDVPDELGGVPVIGKFTGIVSGLSYIIVENSYYLKNLIIYFTLKTKIDAIQYIFPFPRDLAGDYELKTVSYNFGDYHIGINYAFLEESDKAKPLTELTQIRATNLNGYTPKNNKLFTYPYNYFYVTNNSGSEVEFKYEDFSSDDYVRFNVWGAICPSCAIRLIPQNYKNVEDNYNEGVNGGKLPMFSWNSDVYINWLTQSAINIGLDFASEGLSLGASAVTGNGMGVANSLLSIGSSVGEIYQHSKIPNQAKGNVNCGDINYAMDKFGFEIYPMCIKQEYAKIIDNYFNMFGYKVNEVKTPNLKSRRNYNYIKTINADFTGNFNQFDLKKINDIFNKGIRFWHNTSNFLNYSVNNDII